MKIMKISAKIVEYFANIEQVEKNGKNFFIVKNNSQKRRMKKLLKKYYKMASPNIRKEKNL